MSYTLWIQSGKSDISYLKASWALENSDPLKIFPGSLSQSVSSFVGIMSSCSFHQSCVMMSTLPLLLGMSNS